MYLLAAVLLFGAWGSNLTSSEYLFGYSDTWVQTTGATQLGRGAVVLSANSASTHGTLWVEFADPIPDNSSFFAHVHLLACEDNDAGGHWQNDESGPADTSNEFWFEFIGQGNGSDTQSLWYVVVENTNFVLDQRGVSVVIHSYIDGSKQLCADLDLVSGTNVRLIASNDPKLQWTAINAKFSASGFVSVWAGDSRTYSITSFTSSPALGNGFAGHIHKESCASDGSGHWKFDTESEDSSTANEFHYIFSDERNSTWGLAVVNDNFQIDPYDETVASVVVHNEDSSKVICTNLELASSGGFVPSALAAVVISLFLVALS